MTVVLFLKLQIKWCRLCGLAQFGRQTPTRLFCFPHPAAGRKGQLWNIEWPAVPSYITCKIIKKNKKKRCCKVDERGGGSINQLQIH